MHWPELRFCPINLWSAWKMRTNSLVATDNEYLLEHGVEPTDEELEQFMDRVDSLVAGGKVSLATARRVALGECVRRRHQK